MEETKNKSKTMVVMAAILFFMALIFMSVGIYAYLSSKQNGDKTNKPITESDKLKSVDSDADGLNDYDEIYVYKTNPNDADTDKDGFEDGREVKNGYSPLEKIDMITLEGVGSSGVVDIKADRYDIHGFSSVNVDRIEVRVTDEDNKENIWSVREFEKGDTSWIFTLKIEDGTINYGKNEIEVVAYKGDKTSKYKMTLNVEKSQMEAGVVEIEWDKKLVEQAKKDPNEIGMKSFKAGKIVSGDYKDFAIYLEDTYGLGNEYKHYVLKNGSKFYLEENGIRILGLYDDIPKEINLKGSKYILKKYPSIANDLFSEIKISKVLFTDPKLGNIYLADEGCIVIEMPDHTALSYYIELPFLNKENGNMDVTFNDGEKSGESYDYTKISGCGALCTNLYEVSKEEINPDEGIASVGKTSNGETVYKLKDDKDKILLDLYNDKNTQAYYGDNWVKLDNNKYSYQEFLDLNPLLYCKDPLERLIQFKNR